MAASSGPEIGTGADCFLYFCSSNTAHIDTILSCRIRSGSGPTRRHFPLQSLYHGKILIQHLHLIRENGDNSNIPPIDVHKIFCFNPCSPYPPILPYTYILFWNKLQSLKIVHF
jgi:hypothetical protein